MDIDTKISHYKIIKKVGAGGMGEVYLAEDTKLDRRIALKILPAEFAADQDRMSRFVREAKSASALNHPNIITIYEIGESDRTHFIATEFIDGTTLSDFVKSSPLDLKSILDIAVQVVSALQTAHSANIIHRDIKPDNIMIRADGLAKILDFGIAKLSAPTTGEGEAATMIQAQTQAGMVIGTPNYMSPEQARGQTVDQQTDIFSFGVVFYEMLSGTSPFAGDTVGDVIASVLMKEPSKLTNVPPELEKIVQKALRKDKSDRYKSAKDLLDDLREIKQELEFQDKLKRTTGSRGAEEPKTQIIPASRTGEADPKSAAQNLKSIVVLPFSNIGADAEDEYFSDGLTEEIISDLSNIKSLRVISRNSAMKLKGADKDLKTITEELKVRYVLDGSVRKAGDKLRISVQLIDGATDANLWAEKYTGSLDDIFEIQESVSRSIAEALKITLTTGEIKQIEERPISDAQAYDLYLRARTKFHQGNPEALDRSIELLKQGLEIIGENELLYAALGYTYYFYFRWISKLDENYLRLARECRQKLFVLNPDSSHGYCLQGFLSYSEGDIGKAVYSLEKAIELQPTNTEALLWLAIHYEYVDNIEGAMKCIDKARLIDPLVPLNTIIKGFVYIFNGDFEQSLPWVERGLAIDVALPISVWAAAIAKAWCGKIDEATAHVDELAGIAPGWVYTEHALFLKHALRGEKQLALAHYTPDFDKEAAYDCHFALHVAHCFALIGEKEKALDFLETAVRTGLVNHRFLSKLDPLLENIRGEERFKSLMKEAKRLFEEINDAADGTNFHAAPENTEEAQTQILPAATTAETGIGNSIAVLPFANMSADEDNEYFCDGLAEELLNALSKIEDLKVAARTSAFSFKGRNAHASEIGEKLGVKNVLEGSVRRSGDKLRISVQLINAANGFQLWSERYDREMKDIFDVQDEIALAVVDVLKLKLFGDERAIVLEHYTHNTEAYQLYLKGRYQANKFTREGFDKAIDYFNQALAQDPNFALVYVGMADAYYHAATFHLSPREAFLLLKDAATKALELDASLAEAHTLLALFTANYDRELFDAEAGFKRGVELGQNNSVTHQYYGLFLAFTKRFDEGIKELQRAQNLDPLSLVVSFLLGWAYYFARQPEKLMEESRKSLEIEPNFWVTHWNLALGYEQTGQYKEALVSLETARSLEDSPWISAVKARICARQKRPDEARKILDELTAKSNQKWVAPYMVATAYLSLDERGKAFEWLEKAFDECDEWIQCLTVDPALDALRSEPRFQTLVRRMGFPTDKRNITDESLEAGTVMLRTGDATSNSAAKDLTTENAQTNPLANPKPEVQKPKSKWWLFGVLGLLALVGGLFGYKYFAPASKQIESIAVMPFVNESGNADNDYLSDGMTETLIGSLSQLPNLNVKARSSVFRYKGKEIDPKKIASELNVRAILTGRVVQRGEQLRLSLELIDANTENVIWSENYNRKQSDLVSLQSEIARDVSGKLKAKLSGAETARIEKRYTDNNEAYQLYLKGRYFGRQYTLEGFHKSVEQYNRAIALDPNFALAYAGLSVAFFYASTIHLPPLEALPKAKEYALKALEHDDSLAAAHHSIANLKTNFDHDFAGAEREYERAIELDPNDASIYYDYSYLASQLGDFDKGISLAERAHEIDPFAGEISAYLGGSYSMAGQNDKAIEQLQAALKIDDRNWWAYYWLGVAYNEKGMFDQSIKALNAAAKLDNSPLITGALAHALARSGNKAEAQRVVNGLLEESKTRFVSQTSLVIAYAGLGDKEKAFEWFEKSYEAHDEGIMWSKNHPMFAPLRDDPRYRAMLKRVNLPE